MATGTGERTPARRRRTRKGGTARSVGKRIAPRRRFRGRRIAMVPQGSLEPLAHLPRSFLLLFLFLFPNRFVDRLSRPYSSGRLIDNTLPIDHRANSNPRRDRCDHIVGINNPIVSSRRIVAKSLVRRVVGTYKKA